MIPLEIDGAYWLAPAAHDDGRGTSLRLYERDGFCEVLEVQNPLAGTLRGLHYQCGQAKLMRVLQGSVHDVLLDVRIGSPTYGKVEAFAIGSEESLLFIPPGVAHGYLTREPATHLLYFMNQPYREDASLGLHYSSVPWPAHPTLVSERDQAWPEFR